MLGLNVKTIWFTVQVFLAKTRCDSQKLQWVGREKLSGQRGLYVKRVAGIEGNFIRFSVARGRVSWAEPPTISP